MWRKTETHIDFVDSKIVARDFIICEGFSSIYGFLNNKNLFERSLSAPIMYIFKVHRNHPMRIFSTGTNHINIYPANEHKRRHLRMPAEVYRDKMDYDLSTLMLVPFENPYGIESPWGKIEIKKAFILKKEKEGPFREISLIYLDHGTSIQDQDVLKISEVMPSQVINHVFHWLNKEITFQKKTFKPELEGRIIIPINEVRNLTAKLSGILEKRYNTRLMFEHYRKMITSS